MSDKTRRIIFGVFVILLLGLVVFSTVKHKEAPKIAYLPQIPTVLFFPTSISNMALVGYQMDNQNDTTIIVETPSWATIVDPIHVYDVLDENSGISNWAWMDAQQTILAGRSVIYSIKNVPIPWREKPEYACSKPLVQYWQSYAQFVVDFYFRYYTNHKVIAIELWNEPNAPWQGFDPNGQSAEYYGCWGDTTKVDFDGSSYGQFYQYVRNYLRSHNINVPILFLAWNGSLSYDSITFLTSALANAGTIDGLSYHAYSAYEYPETWSVVYDRYVYLKTVTSVNLWVTETALQYSGAEPTTEFRNRQAEYLEYVVINNPNLKSVIWYSHENSWKWVGLVSGAICYPAWNKFITMPDWRFWR